MARVFTAAIQSSAGSVRAKAMGIAEAMLRGVAVPIIAVLLASTPLSGVIAKSHKWNCVYPVVATPKGVAKQDFRMEFAYDDITQKAVIIGNAGVADVEIHMGPGSVTFMEKLAGGVVQTTTVANNGQSVHSRHTILGGEFIASQSYGHCEGQ